MRPSLPVRVQPRHDTIPKSTPVEKLEGGPSRLRKLGGFINRQAEKLGEFISFYTAPDNPPDRNRKIGYAAVAATAMSGIFFGGLAMTKPTGIDQPPRECLDIMTDEECSMTEDEQESLAPHGYPSVLYIEEE